MRRLKTIIHLSTTINVPSQAKISFENFKRLLIKFRTEQSTIVIFKGIAKFNVASFSLIYFFPAYSN